MKTSKKRAGTKKAWITNIPMGVCIFLIAVGLILGNVFVIVTWNEGRVIDKKEAIPVTATFVSYTMHTSAKGSLNEVELRFHDHEELYVDGACVVDDVINALDNLKNGDKVDLLLHPVSNNIWEMKSVAETILSFDDAKSRTLFDNIAFSVLGLFCYGMAVMGAISLFVQRKNRRNEKR